jgi:hypothetical protein
VPCDEFPRAATLECEPEAMEGKLSRGEPADLDAYERATNGLRRVLETLGIERAPSPPIDLTAYLKAKRAEEAEGVA